MKVAAGKAVDVSRRDSALKNWRSMIIGGVLMEIIKIGLITLGSVLSLEGLVLFIAYMYFKDNKESDE